MKLQKHIKFKLLLFFRMKCMCRPYWSQGGIVQTQWVNDDNFVSCSLTFQFDLFFYLLLKIIQKLLPWWARCMPNFRVDLYNLHNTLNHVWQLYISIFVNGVWLDWSNSSQFNFRIVLMLAARKSLQLFFIYQCCHQIHHSKDNNLINFG